MLSSCTIGGYDEEKQSGTGIVRNFVMFQRGDNSFKTLFGSQSECIVEDCTIEFCFGSCKVIFLCSTSSHCQEGIAVILNGTAKIKVR